MSIARSGLIVSLCSAANMLMTVASQLVIAHHFGAGSGLDAFLLAQILPLYLQTLIVPSITVATTPAIIAEQTAHGEHRATQLTASLARRLLLCMAAIALICAVTPSATVRLIAGTAPSALQHDAAHALPWLAAALVPQALGSFYAGVQNIRGNFLLPTLSTGIGLLANILFILLAKTTSPTDTLALAYAFGALVQFASCALMPMLRTVRLSHPDISVALRRIIRSIWPLILFGIVSRAMPLMERSIAADLPPGSISHLNYASKIANILDTLIGYSLATVLLPELSKLASQNSIEALADTYRKALYLAAKIALPIGLVCAINAHDITVILLQRGNFTPADAQMTATLLPLYVMGVLFAIFGTVIGRFLYAQGKTLAFNIAGAIVGLIYPLTAVLLKPQLGAQAMAWAQALCGAIGVLAGFALVAQQTKPINLAFMRCCLAASAAAVFIFCSPPPELPASLVVKIAVQSLYCLGAYGVAWSLTMLPFKRTNVSRR